MAQGKVDIDDVDDFHRRDAGCVWTALRVQGVLEKKF
jgi:hypothetical protein